MTIKTRITTAIATGAVLLNALAPVALAEEVTVTGNGAFSDNIVKLESDKTTVVDQTNDANITNKIDSNATTGGNTANFNTGGDTRIVTGDAVSNVDVSTAVNLNKAVLNDCGTCEGGDVDLKISGNGAFSDNTIKYSNDSLVNLSQNNDAYIKNDIDSNVDTGKNDASFNTGGDTVIVTGDAKSNVEVHNLANANVAKIGGGYGNSGDSSVTLSGNGAFSDNIAKINSDSAIVLDQYNDADIKNYIDANANTGKNDASFNTGGDTAIVTGDAKSYVDVHNIANFNEANIGCDCYLNDLKVKIHGNGAESYNKVAVDKDYSLFDYQDNYADIYNDVDSKAKTGYNDISFSTGDVYSDPLIKTGDAKSYTGVHNSGNVNVLNDGYKVHLPGGYEVNALFDLHDLLSYLHLG